MNKQRSLGDIFWLFMLGLLVVYTIDGLPDLSCRNAALFIREIVRLDLLVMVLTWWKIQHLRRWSFIVFNLACLGLMVVAGVVDCSPVSKIYYLQAAAIMVLFFFVYIEIKLQQRWTKENGGNHDRCQW